MKQEEIWTLGETLRRLRTQKGVTLQALCEGVCSAATLSRIESGERDVDFASMELFFERLGFSADKFELYVGKEEMDRLNGRRNIQELFREGSFGRLLEETERYRREFPKGLSRPEEQFLLKMEGLARQRLGEALKAEKLLEQAALVTIPLENEAWSSRMLLGTQELELLEELTKLWEDNGEKQRAVRMREEMFRYLDTDGTRKYQLPSVYLRLADGLVPEYLKEGRTEKALEMCGRSLEVLKKTQKLYRLAEMMEWKGRCEEQMAKSGRMPYRCCLASYRRALCFYQVQNQEADAERIRQYLEEREQWESI